MVSPYIARNSVAIFPKSDFSPAFALRAGIGPRAATGTPAARIAKKNAAVVRMVDLNSPSPDGVYG